MMSDGTALYTCHFIFLPLSLFLALSKLLCLMDSLLTLWGCHVPVLAFIPGALWCRSDHFRTAFILHFLHVFIWQFPSWNPE